MNTIKCHSAVLYIVSSNEIKLILTFKMFELPFSHCIAWVVMIIFFYLIAKSALWDKSGEP